MTPSRTRGACAALGAAILLAGSASALEAAERYVALTGSNSNTGTITAPWRNIDYAVDHLAPGDTLYVRGGTYFEQVSASVSGTASAPITIRSYPGERGIIDSGPQMFRTPGNNDWELVNAALGEWRSVQSYSGGNLYTYIDGIPNYSRGRVGLNIYKSAGPFRATTDVYSGSSSSFYIGPGTFPSSGRVHIRLAKTAEMRAYEARYGTVFATENADPRNYSIIMSGASSTLNVSGSYLIFRDLTVHQASKTIMVTSHHLTFDGMTVWTGDSAFKFQGANANNIIVRNSRVYGDVPNWISWSDAKSSPAPADIHRGCMILMDGGSHDVTLDHNHIRGGHDGIGVDDDEYNLFVHHNRIEDFHDDAFELEGTTNVGHIEIFENYIGNSLIAVAPGQDTASYEGPLLVYRNVIVFLRKPFINRAPGIEGWNGGERFDYDYMFKMDQGGSYTTQNTHYYHNTIVMLSSGSGNGLNITPKYPDYIRVANNILIFVNGRIEETLRRGTGTVIDGNLYWKINTVDTENLVMGYQTVDALNAATGLEASGIGDTPRRGTNPKFTGFNLAYTNQTATEWAITAASESWKKSSFLLASDSPARGAGIVIPSHPTVGILPDTRSSRDIGAIPFGTPVSELDVFPFVPNAVVVDDSIPPTVLLTSPSSGATVSGTVTVAANASDDKGLRGVAFMLNGAPIGSEDTTAPYSISWNTAAVPNGTRTLTAVAYDNGGNQTTSSPVNVTVSNIDAAPPTVSITAPTAGSTITATTTVTANASDNIGVAGVRFRVNGTDIGPEDTAAPWSISWNAPASGTGARILTAIARDAAGNTTTSASVSVTVSTPNTPPSGTITTPSADITVQAGDSVTFTGSGTDPDGHTPLTYLWTFGGAAPNTTVQNPGGILFSTAGVYTVTFTVRDSQGVADPTPATRVITVTLPGGVIAAEARIANGNDDAEEDSGGNVVQNPDLDLLVDSGGAQALVAVRFPSLNIPQGAVIISAWVQFLADESQSEATTLTIQGEDTNTSVPFSATTDNISSRARTSASVPWSPAAWSAGEAGLNQRTPNLAAIIQEIVSRPAWAPGSALTLLFSGSGKRTAEAFEGSNAGAPLLHIEYTGGVVDVQPPAPPTNLQVSPAS